MVAADTRKRVEQKVSGDRAFVVHSATPQLGVHCTWHWMAIAAVRQNFRDESMPWFIQYGCPHGLSFSWSKVGHQEI
jgi:tRNA-dihydrouridine synthase